MLKKQEVFNEIKKEVEKRKLGFKDWAVKEIEHWQLRNGKIKYLTITFILNGKDVGRATQLQDKERWEKKVVNWLEKNYDKKEDKWLFKEEKEHVEYGRS